MCRSCYDRRNRDKRAKVKARMGLGPIKKKREGVMAEFMDAELSAVTLADPNLTL